MYPSFLNSITSALTGFVNSVVDTFNRMIEIDPFGTIFRMEMNGMYPGLY